MHFKWYTFDKIEVSTAISMLALRHRIFGDVELYAAQEVDDADKTASHLCVIENNDVIACLRLCQLRNSIRYDKYDIGRVCVHSDYRSQNIARKMLGMAVIRGLGNCPEAQFETRGPVYLVDLYKSAGFEPVGDPYREDDIPHLRLKLSQPALLEIQSTNLNRRPVGRFKDFK